MFLSQRLKWTNPLQFPYPSFQCGLRCFFVSSITPSNHCQNVKFLPGRLSCSGEGFWRKRLIKQPETYVVKKLFWDGPVHKHNNKKTPNTSSPQQNKCIWERGKKRHGQSACLCVAYTRGCEAAETWCSCNLMSPMVCAECECVFCYRQLLWARKWGLQPFTVWTNRPIKMKTWLPMRRSCPSQLQNRAVGTLQMEQKIFLCMNNR